MSHDTDRPGVSGDQPAWQRRLSLYADVLGIIGGVGFVFSILWWSLSQPQHPFVVLLFFISVGISIAFIFIFLLDRLLATHDHPLESIGEHLSTPAEARSPIKTLTTQENAASQERQFKSSSELQLAPNIVCLPEDRLDFVELDRHQVFRESEYYGSGALRAVAAAFTNAPKPPHKVGSASNVSAQIEVYEAEWPDRERYRVNYACWLNEESPYVSFKLGTVHHVVLGVFQHKKDGASGFEPEFTIYGNSPDRNAPLSKYPDRFSKYLKIKVRLIVGEHGEFSSEHDFELQHTPGQGFTFGYVSEEEKQQRRTYFNGEVSKLIAKGEAFVTIPLINPNWEELYDKIHKWKAEVSTLLHRHHGWPLSHCFSNTSEPKPYPHKIPDGYRSFFDALYTQIENLKEIAREQGVDAPVTDVPKQVEEVAAKRRVKILKDLSGFAEQANELLDCTKTMRVSLGERDLYVWDNEIFDYLSEHLDRADALMMNDASLEDYTPPEDVPQAFHDLFRKVHTRLARLTRLIEEIESCRHVV
jgi:hypothetical protein